MDIKKLQNNYTTPEQSKRLLELGVPADSADCFYKEPYTIVNVLRNCDEFSYYCGDIDRNVDYLKYTPCWSAGRLMEIYVIARGLDTAYLPIERGEDMVKYLIRLYEEKAKDLDFSKLEN